MGQALSIEEINNLSKENEKMKATLEEIKRICKDTTALVNLYGYERDYSYKAVVKYNNKILRKIKEVIK